MSLPIPVFFIASIAFVAFLAFRRGRQTQNQDNANRSFLERERKANATRKKDISALDYLPYHADRLSFPETSDPELLKLESVLKELDGKRIINLSQYSNTDLKLMYGPANLNDLTEYDDNYYQLSTTLLAYAQRAFCSGHIKAATAVLEYAMELKIALSQIYLLLADLYEQQGTSEKTDDIVRALSSMEESFAAYVLPKLTTSRTAK